MITSEEIGATITKPVKGSNVKIDSKKNKMKNHEGIPYMCALGLHLSHPFQVSHAFRNTTKCSIRS